MAKMISKYCVGDNLCEMRYGEQCFRLAKGIPFAKTQRVERELVKDVKRNHSDCNTGAFERQMKSKLQRVLNFV